MAKSTYLRISASRTPYRRAHLNLTLPVEIEQSVLSADQLAALKRDPIVHIDAIEAAAMGHTADELIKQAAGLATVTELDALAENETRKTVLEAIKARRKELA